MSGLYLHIPFCRTACHYCDFHFSTNRSYQNDMVAALCKEIKVRKDFMKEELSSIYFGGGTPSLLTAEHLDQVFEAIYTYFPVNCNTEITLESNPDDLNPFYLNTLISKGINRLSIGFQSFDQKFLKLLNRIHDPSRARIIVEEAREAGFKNISIDLIYGIPAPENTAFLNDLEHCFYLAPEHISAYCLTVEPKTVFGRWLEKGKFIPADDEFSATQFEILTEAFEEKGYEQYEISNFARNQIYSRHNSGYWKGNSFLGIGPGAHSYDGNVRSFNIANNHLYLKKLSSGEPTWEEEILEKSDRFNEYILTSIRTKWGISFKTLEENFPENYGLTKEKMAHLEKNGLGFVEEELFKLTKRGKLLADEVSTFLFQLS